MKNNLKLIETRALEVREPVEPDGFDRVLLDLMAHARLVDRFQVINGTKPELLAAALDGEHVGSLVFADR